MCVCVCVCVCNRERERERDLVCMETMKEHSIGTQEDTKVIELQMLPSNC